MLSVYDVTRAYMDIADQYDNRFANTKYMVWELMKNHIGKIPQGNLVSRAKDMEQLRQAVSACADVEAVTGPYQAPVHVVPRPWDLDPSVPEPPDPAPDEPLPRSNKYDDGYDFS
eukprot:TRINITY_DN6086_c0_g2_i7.p1 TRINITY_DN6086_c0_g2~~TRINITY_DN6086_c0_g2_i7.p1  ORF type:complete len:115 (+),score=24.36 TRINITY_DN6086_c0_g2_i7:130-474(+)